MGMLHGHGCCMGMLLLQNRDAWCMGHGMLLLQNRDAWCMASLQQQHLLRACMRACVAAFVIDTNYSCRGFVRKGDRVHIINFRDTTSNRMQSK
jgi:hypothetical protein